MLRSDCMNMYFVVYKQILILATKFVCIIYFSVVQIII
jgi:hypothetical protein